MDDKEEDETNAPERAEFIRGREKPLLGIAFAAYAVAIGIGLWHSVETATITLLPLIAGVVYSSDVMRRVGLPRLKDITGVKNILIAVAWGATVSLLPTTIMDADLDLTRLLMLFFMGKSMVNTIIFDARDVEGDREAGVRTIPVVLGTRRTRWMLLLVNTGLLPWLCYWAQHHTVIPVAVVAISIAYGYMTIQLYCGRRARHESLDLIVDGEWAVLAVLALLLVSYTDALPLVTEVGSSTYPLLATSSTTNV